MNTLEKYMDKDIVQRRAITGRPDDPPFISVYGHCYYVPDAYAAKHLYILLEPDKSIHAVLTMSAEPVPFSQNKHDVREVA